MSRKYEKDKKRKHRRHHDDDDDRHRRSERRRSSSHPPAPKRVELSLSLESLEVAKGFDGPLRGHPEPNLLFSVFGVKDDQISLLGRALRQLEVSGPYPKTLEPRDKRERYLLKVSLPDAWTRLLVLGLAIEKDGGKDIEELFASLAEPRLLSSWSIPDVMPEPVSLAEAGMGALSTPPAATLVHLMRDGVTLEETCTRDDYVGCSFIVLDPKQRQEETWRFHFATDAGKNDWTALICARI